MNQAQQKTANRLREALSELITQYDTDAEPKTITVTAVCERARISRNALYRYHRDVLSEIKEWQQRHSKSEELDKEMLAALRDTNASLRTQINQLAALVDHYFSAWTETKTLLARREAELARLCKSSRLTLMSAPVDSSGSDEP